MLLVFLSFLWAEFSIYYLMPGSILLLEYLLLVLSEFRASNPTL